jgi:hypothetical protein
MCLGDNVNWTPARATGYTCLSDSQAGGFTNRLYQSKAVACAFSITFLKMFFFLIFWYADFVILIYQFQLVSPHFIVNPDLANFFSMFQRVIIQVVKKLPQFRISQYLNPLQPLRSLMSFNSENGIVRTRLFQLCFLYG